MLINWCLSADGWNNKIKKNNNQQIIHASPLYVYVPNLSIRRPEYMYVYLDTELKNFA